ncbi:unnamed protein product [Linum trigynum]|uniref:Uncharacterized protein n=1 Tax=Linum trigynum TaxID=586398 RepID=A0AAV2EJC7_9ROSI
MVLDSVEIDNIVDVPINDTPPSKPQLHRMSANNFGESFWRTTSNFGNFGMLFRRTSSSVLKKIAEISPDGGKSTATETGRQQRVQRRVSSDASRAVGISGEGIFLPRKEWEEDARRWLLRPINLTGHLRDDGLCDCRLSGYSHRKCEKIIFYLFYYF